MDYDGSVVPIGKLMKYSTRKIINFLKLSFYIYNSYYVSSPVILNSVFARIRTM